MNRLIILISALLFFPAYANACNVEAPCTVAGGDYMLSAPLEWDGEAPLPAMIWYHGHNSSAASAMRSASLKVDFVDRGWLLIAPNGAPRAGSGVRGWPARPDLEDLRDDMALTFAVLEDVKQTYPIDEDALIVAGFSAGGSMAWMMGCYHGSKFRAVVSVAGALRRPNPEICPDMVQRALHFHGFADKQVPFEGRSIRDWHQGSVQETLGLFRRSHGCRSQPDAIDAKGDWRQREWSSCAGGLSYREHDGGHGLPKGWTSMAREWLAQN
ncbi:MAG: alpha/beta hydrolase family esterase [Pikeienuella sp.]